MKKPSSTDPKPQAPAADSNRRSPPQKSSSKKADVDARKGEPLPASKPAERSPKQENL